MIYLIHVTSSSQQYASNADCSFRVCPLNSDPALILYTRIYSTTTVVDFEAGFDHLRVRNSDRSVVMELTGQGPVPTTLTKFYSSSAGACLTVRALQRLGHW
jgi:hypothetical protein